MCVCMYSGHYCMNDFVKSGLDFRPDFQLLSSAVTVVAIIDLGF